MPFEPDPRDPDSTITIREYNRKRGEEWNEWDKATRAAASMPELKKELADLKGRLATMPDATKAAKRADKADERALEWEKKFTTATSEYTTEKALLTAGIVDVDDMALIRHKFSLSGGDDFGKYLAEAARADKHLAPLFAPPNSDTPPAPPTDPTTPPPRPTPPATNGGVHQPPPPGQVRDGAWLSTQTLQWKNDRANWPEINRINGVDADYGIKS